jgi:hypothetical protein
LVGWLGISQWHLQFNRWSQSGDCVIDNECILEAEDCRNAWEATLNCHPNLCNDSQSDDDDDLDLDDLDDDLDLDDLDDDLDLDECSDAR